MQPMRNLPEKNRPSARTALRPVASTWRAFLSVSLTLCLALTLLPGCTQVVNYTDPNGPLYTGSFPTRPDPEPALRVVSFNIQHGRHIDEAIELLTEDPSLRGADILFLQEMDAEGTRRIAKALGMSYIYYPAVIHPASDRDFGNAILARWPIDDPEKIILPHRARFGGSQRIATAGTIRIGGQEVRLYSVHIAVPFMLSGSDRREQARTVATDAASEPGKVIVGGDLNSHGLGKIFAEEGLAWLSREVGSTRLWFDLDHIFVRGFHLVAPDSIGVVRDNRGASDHLPVWTLLE